jgi:type II secretory pathway pseudopilin PulG
MKYFLKQKNTKNSGFTLVETLLALSIFSISVLSMMIVLSKGISDTDYAQQKIIATYLAQEGIETMRNMRDTYILYSTPVGAGWATFKGRLTGANCNTANGCFYDDRNLVFNDPVQPITNPSYVPINGCNANCPMLLYSSTTGKYNYASGGVSSGFRRKITSSTAGLGLDEVKISSTVSFTHKLATYNITITENLFNWAE